MKDNQLTKEYLQHKQFVGLVCLQDVFEARRREDRSGSRVGTMTYSPALDGFPAQVRQ